MTNTDRIPVRIFITEYPSSNGLPYFDVIEFEEEQEEKDGENERDTQRD